jgi:hypothetical protein
MAMAAWVWAYVVQDGVNELITKQDLEREAPIKVTPPAVESAV